MSTRKLLAALLALLAIALPLAAASAQNLGEPAAADVVARWDSTVFPDGRGLPPGAGDAAAGKAIYDARCSSCHGPEGRGETAEELAGRDPPLTDPDAAQTVGSYWPYAATLFDYIRRAMPMDQPGSLSNDEAYAVSAYLLSLDGIVGERDAMNATTLPAVKMPNRDGFRSIDAK